MTAGVRPLGGGKPVDARDLAAWTGVSAQPEGDDAVWREEASAYVAAHPRPGSGFSEAQRLVLLRRLAAGPATSVELLAALRTVGWVGASDLENRVRELRGGSRGAGRGGLDLRSQAGRHWLAAPLPALDDAQVQAIGFAQAMLTQLDTPMAAAATRALGEVLPGLNPAAASGTTPPPARLTLLERFHEALDERRPVRLRYDSRNTGLKRLLTVVPLEYVPIGGLVKAVCVEVDRDGRRRGVDRQLVLERIIEVEPLPDWADPEPQACTLVRDELVIHVPEALAEIIHERGMFGTDGSSPTRLVSDAEVYEVTGTFPRALAWDVMEQLCAWAGSVQVHAPLWLVNAVCRRLRAGLEEMETAAGFRLVKPDPTARFTSHAEAVGWEPGPAASDPRGRARRLAPRP